ncbi:MAG: hypothetical protein K6360_02760 [Deltaproteobacteria bacterium]
MKSKRFIPQAVAIMLLCGPILLSPDIVSCEEGVVLSPIEQMEQEPHFYGTIDHIDPKAIVIDDSGYSLAPNLIVLTENGTQTSYGSLKVGDYVAFTLSGKETITSIKRVSHLKENKEEQGRGESTASRGNGNRQKGNSRQILKQQGDVWRNY